MLKKDEIENITAKYNISGPNSIKGSLLINIKG